MSSTPESAPPRAPSPPGLDRFLPRRSAGLKFLLVCALALVMSIPALFVYGVVAERTSGQARAMADISQRVGGAQQVLGPFLAVPYARTPDPEKPSEVVYGHVIAFAETGSAEITVSVEERRRGIYRVPVFEADAQLTARFDAGAVARAVPGDARAIWQEARLYSGISDMRGLRALELRVDGAVVEAEPAAPSGYGSGEFSVVPPSPVRLASARIEGLQTRTGMMDVALSLRLSGAERLALAPFAKETRMTMASNWASPSFTGGVLPSSHTAGEGEGFTATWEVPYLARGVAGAGSDLSLHDLMAWDTRDMAVRFVQPANPYQSVERALKYGAMFIGFVFLTWFLFEVTRRARAHPAQYILVGLAQCIFYLLLLAFAERMGFDLAFGLAAAMTVALIALYSVSVFASLATGLKALAALSGIYGLIYVLMRAEDYALLAGALASFAAIALTMFMTRNVSWYSDRPE